MQLIHDNFKHFLTRNTGEGCIPELVFRVFVCQVYDFNNQYVKTTEAAVKYFLPHSKEFALWLRAKRLYRNSVILNWRNNTQLQKLAGSKSTLIRHFNYLIKEGLIVPRHKDVVLVGIETLLDRFGKSHFIYLDNDSQLPLRLIAAHLKASERKQKKAMKFNEHANYPKPVYKYQITVAESFVTTATYTDVNYSCRTLSRDLGAVSYKGDYSPTNGWRVFQKLQTEKLVTLWRRKLINYGKRPFLSYEFKVNVNTDVRDNYDENWSNFAIYW